MISVRKATLDDVEGICRVCAAGWRATYAGLVPHDYIEEVIAEFYTPDRVRSDIETAGPTDTGWLVAVEDGQVVGAGGGGITSPGVGEIFILYVDPERRGQGIGTLLLDEILKRLKEFGAREVWVSVMKGNDKGIPFYEARGFVARGERPAFRSRPEQGIVAIRYWRAL